MARSHSNPLPSSRVTWAVVAVLLCLQAALPHLHAWHLASHAQLPQTAAKSCCHHHDHHQAPSDTGEDESCPTCVTLAFVRNSAFSLDEPVVALIHARTPVLIDLTLAHGSFAPALTARNARGPPAA